MTEKLDTHPQKQLLKAFGLGTLDELASAEIEKHLEECPDCCETILGLQDDTFLSLVRKAPAEAVSPTESDQATSGTTEPASSATDFTRQMPAQGTVGMGGDATVTSQAGGLPGELRQHPRYEVLDLIGHGGMGDVYRAQHKLMNRIVALKVIKPELVQNEAAVKRFHREVQTAARLHHGNIVTAYDAEQAGAVHFLVMEYVDGVNLHQVIKDRGAMPQGEACDVIRQTARGLQHAHELGMVHRDIKPHNLMLTRSGDVKILDFGLANFASETIAEELGEENPRQDVATIQVLHQLTQSGTMMGTPDYIAPEQARDAHEVDIRADIYSLGCTFYTLLTGQAPFGEGSVLQKIKAHAEDEAPPVSDFRDDVPPEVMAILQKMMAKNPDDRYQSPGEVVQALQKVRSPELPATAEKTTWTPPRRSWPPAVWLAAGLLLLAAGVLLYIKTDNGTLEIKSDDPNVVVKIEQNGKEVSFLNTFTQKKTTLDTGTYRLRYEGLQDGYEVEVPEGGPLVLRRRDNKTISIRRVPEPPQPANQPGLENLKPQPPVAHTTMPLVREFTEPKSFIRSVTFSPDGELAAAVTERGRLHVWEVETRKSVLEENLAPQFRDVAFSPDGRWVGASGGPEAWLWELSSGKSRKLEFRGDKVSDLVFLTAELCAGVIDGDSIHVWKCETGERAYAVSGGSPLPAGDGEWFAVYRPDGIAAHEIKAGQQLETYKGGSFSPTWRLGMSRDGFKLAAGSEMGDILIWDADSGDPVHRLRGHVGRSSIGGISRHGGFSQFRDYLVSQGDDGTYRVWNVKTGEPVRIFPFSTQGGTLHNKLRSEFLDHTHLLFVDADDVIHIWDIGGNREVVRFQAPADSTRDIAVSPDNRYLLTAGGFDEFSGKFNDTGDYKVRLWQLPEGVWPQEQSRSNEITLDKKLAGAKSGIARVVFSKNGKYVLAVAGSQVFRWDRIGGTLEGSYTLGESSLENILPLADNQRVVVSTRAGKVQLWNLKTETVLREFKSHNGITAGLAVSPDEKLVASGGDDKHVRLSNLETGEELQDFDNAWCRILSFTPDGRYLVFGNQFHATMYRIKDWELVRNFHATRTASVRAVALSPDGSFLLTGTDSGGVMLWNVETGQVIHTASLPAPVRSLAFLPDGRHFVAGCEDSTLRLWSTATGKELMKVSESSHATHWLAVAPDGKSIVSGGGVYLSNPDQFKYDFDGDADVRLWQLPKSVWPAPPDASPEDAVVIGMNEEFGLLFQGQLVAPAELGRRLEAALEEKPDRVVAIDLPKKPWTVVGHVDQLEQIARIAGARRITRPAWSEIRIVFGVQNSSQQWIDINGPGYSATGFVKSHLPNVREVVAKNPGLPVLLDVAKGVDLSDARIAAGLDEVCRVAEATGAKVRLGPNLSESAWPQPLPGVKAVGTVSRLSALSASSRREKILAGTEDGKVFCRSVNQGKLLWEASTDTLVSEITVLTMSSGIDMGVFGDADGRIVQCDLLTGKTIRSLGGHFGPVRALTISGDSRRMFSAGLEHTKGKAWRLVVLDWDSETGVVMKRNSLPLPAEATAEPGGKHLVVLPAEISRFPSKLPLFASLAGSSRGWVYDVLSDQPPRTVSLEEGTIRSAAMGGEELLLIGDDKGRFHLLDLRTDDPLRTLPFSAAAGLRSLAWQDDRDHFLSIDDHGTIEAWSISKQKRLQASGTSDGVMLADTRGPALVIATSSTVGKEPAEFALYLWQPPVHASQGQTANPKQPSEFFRALGDLQGMVRKTTGDEAVFLTKTAPAQVDTSTVRSQIVYEAQLTGEEDRGPSVQTALRNRLKSLAKQSDAFVSRLSNYGQDGVDGQSAAYQTAAREGLIRVELEFLQADKRMPAIKNWKLRIHVEEWPREEKEKPAGDAPAETDAHRLQGTWIAFTGTRAGRLLTQQELEAISVSFQGTQMSYSLGGQKHEGTFQVDESRRPKEIDLIPPGAVGILGVSKGIYSLVDNGTLLTLCIGEPKPGEAQDFRPQRLDKNSSEDFVLVNLRKADKVILGDWTESNDPNRRPVHTFKFLESGEYHESGPAILQVEGGPKQWLTKDLDGDGKEEIVPFFITGVWKMEGNQLLTTQTSINFLGFIPTPGAVRRLRVEELTSQKLMLTLIEDGKETERWTFFRSTPADR